MESVEQTAHEAWDRSSFSFTIALSATSRGMLCPPLERHRRATVFSEYPTLRERVSQAMQRENKESLYPARWLSAEAFELFAHFVWLPSRAVVYANLLSHLRRTQLINFISCTQGESSLTRSDQAERIARFEAFTYLDVSDGYEHDSGDNLEVLLHNLQIRNN